jgi:uncharacterized protein YjiS (DUF1127 family)
MLVSFEAWREKRRNRTAYRQLSQLSDKILFDIGLSRDDLDGLRRGRGVRQR